MSRENVEIVRRMFEAFQRQEWGQAVELVDPDIELHGTAAGLTEGSVAHGLEGIRQVFEQDDAEAWDESRLEPEEFIDAGDRVVVLLHEFRRGRGSGVEIESYTAALFEIRDGHVIRVQGYMDRQAALEAVGLRE
jgi:uncharacterized protein